MQVKDNPDQQIINALWEQSLFVLEKNWIHFANFYKKAHEKQKKVSSDPSF